MEKSRRGSSKAKSSNVLTGPVFSLIWNRKSPMLYKFIHSNIIILVRMAEKRSIILMSKNIYLLISCI